MVTKIGVDGRIQRLQSLVDEACSVRTAIQQMGHHYGDAMDDDMVMAIDNLGNVLDALKAIENGEL